MQRGLAPGFGAADIGANALDLLLVELRDGTGEPVEIVHLLRLIERRTT